MQPSSRDTSVRTGLVNVLDLGFYGCGTVMFSLVILHFAEHSACEEMFLLGDVFSGYVLG